MIFKLHHEIMKQVAQTFANYGIQMDLVYNPDVSVVTKYSENFEYVKLLKDIDIWKLNDEELIKLRKQAYQLMMYSYQPMKRASSFNNINLEAFFLPTNKQPDMNKLRYIQDKDLVLFLKKYRELLDDRPDYAIIRDVLHAEINYEINIISASNELIQDIQFIYLRHLQRTLSMKVSFQFWEEIEPIEVTYNTEFGDINQFGYVDYERYGNLQHISFPLTLRGLIFSNYKSNQKVLESINIKVQLTK